MYKRIIVLCFLTTALLITTTAFSQREVINLNRDWKFTDGWEVRKNIYTSVNIPHTWNLDALSGKVDYDRSLKNYIKTIHYNKDSLKGKQIYLRFKGANQTADVYINSKHIGTHKGGYTAFSYNITQHLDNGNNVLWVRLTNALDLDIMPLLGDFNMYGGLYRDVEMIITPDVHISADHYASSGVYIKTSDVTNESADVLITTKINSPRPAIANVKYTIYDADNKEVATDNQRIKFDSRGTQDIEALFHIFNPRLWEAKDNPHMYRLDVVVQEEQYRKNITVSIKDSITQYFGLRYFEVTDSNKFMLNGENVRIKGVSRHQDWALLGNALHPWNHEKDIKWLKEIGANAIRLAHYPQDPYFLELCDRNGIMVWSEIPFVGPGGYRDKGYNDTEGFRANGETQLKEMIHQLYNHPSILWWGIFNELTVRGDNPLETIRHYNNVAKKYDPSRLTVSASNQDGDINYITDLIGFNQYMGWYGGLPEHIEEWGDKLRLGWPTLKVGISEYGAGASIYQHSDSLEQAVPNSCWHPESWQTHFHETYWRSIVNSDNFWGTFVWNMFDFGAAHRTEGDRQGVNDKGLVTFDRATAKDAFYFYKANWNTDDLFVYISERRNVERQDSLQTIKIFSNCKEVELYLNDVSYGKILNDGFGTFVWKNITFRKGVNELDVFGDNFMANDNVELYLKN